MQPAVTSLKMRALQWLSQREHSRLELRRRLLRLATAPGRRRRSAAPAMTATEDATEATTEPAIGTAASVAASHGDAEADMPDPRAARAACLVEIDALLDWLTERGYLSDARFTESRVQVRAQRLGNLRIVQELRQHGVLLGADAKQQLRDTELARATAVWQRKYGSPAADAKGRLRQMRFLAGRGFSADVVRRVLGSPGPECGSAPTNDGPFHSMDPDEA